jgi:hypothetical protein
MRNACFKTENGDVFISEWYNTGGMLYRRDCLPLDHPESMYQCIIRLGLNPTEYGFKVNKCPKCGEEFCYKMDITTAVK